MYLSWLFEGAKTGLEFKSLLDSASYSRGAGRYNQAIAEQNAAGAEAEADFIRQRTLFDVESYKASERKFKGSQRAAIGASGFQVDEDSAALLADTAMQAQIDIELIKAEGSMAAEREERKAANYRAGGQEARYIGKQQAYGYNLGAGASLLKGGSNLYSLWKNR